MPVQRQYERPWTAPQSSVRELTEDHVTDRLVPVQPHWESHEHPRRNKPGDAPWAVADAGKMRLKRKVDNWLQFTERVPSCGCAVGVLAGPLFLRRAVASGHSDQSNAWPREVEKHT